MKFIGINGSPRKGWNTDILLTKALEGAKSEGAEVEVINLYDLDYKGCKSCFACKRKGATVDTCVMNDDLKVVLEKIRDCDGLVLGSPIYMMNITGEMSSFFERLVFPYFSYDGKASSFPKEIETAFIYTMNLSEAQTKDFGLEVLLNTQSNMLKGAFSNAHMLLATETLQFDNYDNFAASIFSADERINRRETVFKDDCKKAYNLGRQMATNMKMK